MMSSRLANEDAPCDIRYSQIADYLYDFLDIVIITNKKTKVPSFIYNEEFLTINSDLHSLEKKIIKFLVSRG